MQTAVRRLAPPRNTAGVSSAMQTVRDAEIHWIAPGRQAPEVFAAAPSVHIAWGGTQILCVDGRTLRLDEDVFLVLNPGHVLSPRGRRDGVHLLSVYFSEEQLRSSLGGALDLGAVAAEPDGGFAFFEHLRERDASVDSVMRYLAHHLRAGVEDPQWFEEQAAFLLGRVLANEAMLAKSVARMSRIRSWRRRETFQRLSRITDLIHCAYERPLTMAELAEAAHWSVFHTIREFKAVHGVSPYEYLQKRRMQAAVRLLSSTDVSVAEIAERVGFHDRSTLMRRLRRVHGVGARALRTSSSEAAQSAQSMQHMSATAAASRVKRATSILPSR